MVLIVYSTDEKYYTENEFLLIEIWFDYCLLQYFRKEELHREKIASDFSSM